MAEESRATSRIVPGRAGFRLVKAGWWVRWSKPLLIFAVWRLWLGIIPFGADRFIAPSSPIPNTLYTPPQLGFWAERLLGVWTHWDGELYLYIAQAGYRPGEITTQVFPLYPFLVWLTSWLFLGNYILAGVVVSNLLAILLFILFYELIKFEYSARLGLRTVLYLAAFPTSFFLVACFSEGLFLSLAVGAFLAARRYHNWWLTGLLIGLAALTRNMGILLLVPLGWEWLRQHRAALFEKNEAGKWRLQIRWKELPLLSTLFFTGLPVLFFGGWLVANWIVLGDPLSFYKGLARANWDRHLSWPWVTVGQTFALFFQEPGIFSPQNPNLVDLPFWFGAVAVFGVGCYLTWRGKFPAAYLIYLALAILVPMSGPNPNEPLLGFPRHILLGFPVIMIMALVGSRWRILHYFYLTVGFLFLTLLFAVFVNWYWVG